jgi:ATP-dependent helicase/nuclease subunit A
MSEARTAVRFDAPEEAASRPAFTGAQARAIAARHPVVGLSAGAGSGKTTVLVERFLSLVDEGCAPPEILAVTFTEKAAAEMKERIVRRFEERGDEANRRLTEAAYISTIHGLCARLLRENPLAARLDPSFGIMDGLTRGIFLDEALQRLYADEWFRDAVERFGADRATGYPALFALVRDAALKPREFGTDAPAEAGHTLEEHVAEAMRRLDLLVEAEWGAARGRVLEVAHWIAGMQVGGNVRAAQHREMCGVLRELAASGAVDPALARRLCDSTGFTGSAKPHPHLGEVRAVFGEVRDVFKRLAGFDRAAQEAGEREVFAPLRVGVYRCAAALREEYDAFKRARGLLDFEDLQARALALLDDPRVLREYAERFRHLLLDEAQDTNPVQMRLVERLLGGRARLFAVGDVKQAIYAFRGAEVSLFQELCEGAGEGRMSLPENFRSRSEVLRLVNRVGERLWQQGAVRFEPLEPGLPYPALDGPPRLELCFFRKSAVEREGGEAEDESTEEVRLREGARFARWIREAVDGTAERGPLQVYDHRRRMRPMRYGDVAVLTRTRTAVPLYEQCLAEEGIPYVKDGGAGFFAGLEVTDVLNALRVLRNPLDDAALLAVLRSPMFAWRDADLVRARRAAGRRRLWRVLEEGFAPEAPGSSPGAHRVLSELRAWAGALPPALLIERLLESTHYRAALLQTPRGRAQTANLAKLVEFARACAELDGPSLPRFVERATLAERHLADEGDATIASTEDDVVTVSTIHGAKGLEWPAVILPCLDTDFAGKGGGSMYSAPDGALLVEPYDARGDILRPMSHGLLRERIREREEAEARRIFYVALTRAREYLVMSGLASYPEKPRLERFRRPIDWLGALLGVVEHEAEGRDHDLDGSPLRLSFALPEDAPAPRPPRGGDAALAEARAGVVRGEPVRWGGGLEEVSPEETGRVIDAVFGPGARAAPAPVATTVTRLAYYYRCPRVYYYDLVLQVEEHPRARRKSAGGEVERLTAVELGTRVHELLERADLAADPGREADRLADAGTSVPEGDRARIRAMLANVLADPVMERARGALRLEREYPFYLELGGSVVQGVIDLVFTDADGRGVVLDYKSNDLSAPDRVRVLTEHYRPQIELYALAARKAGLADPGEAVLYFLNQPVARTLLLDEGRMERIEAEATRILGRIASEDWTTQPGEKCRSCGYRKRGFCEVGREWRG